VDVAKEGALVLAFGDHVLDIGRRELRRGGRPIALPPQIFDLIVYLTQNRDRVVSKDDLLEHVWGGRIVSDSAMTTAINAARQAIGDSGVTQTLIRTIHRKGIRFVGEVTQEHPPAPRSGSEGVERQRPEGSPLSPLAFALPDKPSIAVLPFTNMSSEADQDFFADGIAEDVITALSRYPSLFVIARNSCFTYKGRVVEIRQIGRELGVRYVLEGSLRKSGSRIRVTAQLIEAETGNHVWASRYDRDVTDIFAVQDEISEAVTIAIAPAIAGAERQRAMRRPPNNLDAWAAYQRGLWHLENESAENRAHAEVFFQRAVDLDPNFVGSYCGLAVSLAVGGAIYGLGDLAEALNRAEGSARRAVALDEADAEARVSLAHVLRMRGDRKGAQAEAEMALMLSPNLASAHTILGTILIFAGRPRDGVEIMRRSIRLDPRDPRSAGRLLMLTIALYFACAYEEAVESARSAIRSYPDYPLTYRWLAAGLGQLGRTAEAKSALDDARAVVPTSFELYVRNRMPWFRPEDYEHMLEGLRKAGWDDGSVP
jgi:adenylate cyclase